MGSPADLAQLLMRFASYARHKPWCAYLRGDCDCGFDELLEEMRKLGKRERAIYSALEATGADAILIAKRKEDDRG